MGFMGYTQRSEEKAPIQIVKYDKLLAAVSRSDMTELNLWIEDCFPSPEEDRQRSHPLHKAVIMLNVRMIVTMLKHGASVRVRDEDGNTPLHKMCAYRTGSVRDRMEILNKITKQQDFVANMTNNEGDTPLHLAVKSGNFFLIPGLIECGESLMAENYNGEIPVSNIPLKTLTDILNGCMEKEQEGNDPLVKVNYRCILPPEAISEEGRGIRTLESKFFHYISDHEELRSVITEPFSKIFIDMKWNKLRRWFYVNLIFYTVYLCLLTAFIIVRNKALMHNLVLSCEETIVSSKNTYFYICIIIFNTIILIREVIQMFIYKLKYVTLENVLEILLVVLVYVFCLSGRCRSTEREEMSAIMLIGWGDLFLLLGRHPYFSMYEKILSTVSKTVLTIFFCFSPLLEAFTISFRILFCPPNEFENVPKSLVKTMLMMTGELDYSSLSSSKFGVVSVFVFVCFMFSVTVVLMNLLTGLAVVNIKTIVKKAEIYASESRVNFLWRIEYFFLKCKLFNFCFNDLPRGEYQSFLTYLVQPMFLFQDGYFNIIVKVKFKQASPRNVSVNLRGHKFLENWCRGILDNSIHKERL